MSVDGVYAFSPAKDVEIINIFVDGLDSFGGRWINCSRLF